jgi:isoleucyl-tRNA synthetase
VAGDPRHAALDGTLSQLHRRRSLVGVRAGPVDSPDEALLGKWSRVREVRDTTNKFIEALRTEGKVGSSLQANAEIDAGPKDHAILSSLGEDLKLVLLTSKVRLSQTFSEDADIAVSVTASSEPKCERCWHYRNDVGVDPTHPTICGRCTSNLFGSGETRKVA